MGDLEADFVRAQAWRSDDSDWCAFEGQTGKMEGERGHWMSGSTPFAKKCERFNLSKFLSSWMARAEFVLDSKNRLWIEAESGDSDNYFRLPSPECFELHIDAPFQLEIGRHNGTELRLKRVLVDPTGWPLRV